MLMKYKYNAILRHPGYNGDFADDVLGFDPNGGGIYDIPIVGDVADAVVNSFVGNVIAFAFPPAAPFIYAAKSAQALASGNELGALLNAVGAYSAYVSPTATTTADLGGMEVSGLNANLVNATEQALAGGASVTDVAKTLVGMGDQNAAAKILQSAGQDSAAAMDALNAAGQEAANYVPTAADAAKSVVAMKAAGFSATDIATQVDNWATVIPKDQIATAMGNINAPASWAGLQAPISSIGDNPLGQNTIAVQPPDAITGTPLSPLQTDALAQQYAGFTPEEILEHMAGTDIQVPMAEEMLSNLYLDPFAATDMASAGTGFTGSADTSYLTPNAGVPEGGWDPNYGADVGLGQDIGVGLDEYGLGGTQNQEMLDLQRTRQIDMLTGQYEGFTPEQVVEHMAGSAIDPVMAEEIMGGLGYDQFMVSDYMAKNPTSFGNTYADPSFLDRLKSMNKGLQSLKGIIGSSGGQGSMGGAGGNVDQNYTNLMRQYDPYWDYRKSTEIPMMGAAAGAAGTLSGLYQQSYTDPLQAYNTPEMQAIRGSFMDETQRRDAALGRNSQYSARGVEAQNKYLTNTLPQYRTGLNQGLSTMYQAAKSPEVNAELAVATMLDAGKQAASSGSYNRPTGLAGTVSGLQGSWNQMTQGDNIFDQATGAVNTVQGLQNLYTGGQAAYNTVAGWFA